MGDQVVAPVLPNGAVLPFPPVGSGSVAGRTLQESTYSPRAVPQRLHTDAPNVVIVLIDDLRPRVAVDIRRRGEHRDPRPDLRPRCVLQPVSHHGHVLADPGVVAHRS